ncbi:Alpha/Beta hydrolase protein [Favolaschia claudopus]|uniref:Alpha/Beta hydrolase protein n=1 Tax=Favolaschia claudopus TaxID=2862362 RepID=A0AAW0C4D0_9AGAR
MKVLQALSFMAFASCIAALSLPIADGNFTQPTARSKSSVLPNVAVVWGACNPPKPPLQCATLQVPVDYANPTGAMTQIGMMRSTATNPASRKGTIVYLPGGPGGAASSLFTDPAFSNYFSSAKVVYDILAIDPRGIGLSLNFACNTATWNARVNYFPTTAADFAALTDHNLNSGMSCAPANLMSTLNTLTIVRDIESVRVALGVTQFSFFGDSYGSLTGVTYLEQFPGQTQIMVLDGITDHTQPALNLLPIAATAIETAFNAWVAWCNAATVADCPWSGNAAAQFDALVQQADLAALPAPSCVTSGLCRSTVTGHELLLALQFYLSGLNQTDLTPWRGLAANLAGAHTDAGPFSILLADNTPAQSEFYAITGMLCADWTHPWTTLAQVTAQETALANLAPHTRGASIFWLIQTLCIKWPYPTSFPEHPLKVAPHSPPVVLISSQQDPATPLVGAQRVQQQIPGSVLMTRTGSGHGSYRNNGAVHTAVEAFFVSGTVPQTAIYPN